MQFWSQNHTGIKNVVGKELGSRTYREETHPIKSLIICPVLI